MMLPRNFVESVYFHFKLLKQNSCPVLRLAGTCPFSCNTIKGLRVKNDSIVPQRFIPRTSEEETQSFRIEETPPNAKSLKISIIGVPNSGKSTLINNLIEWKVCSVSKKVHTTIDNSRAVLTKNDTQLVFLDTPGVVDGRSAKKYNMKPSMVNGPEESLQQADLIGVIQDCSKYYSRKALHPDVLKLLAFNPTIPSILILNKIDLITNKLILLDLVGNLTMGCVGGKKVERHSNEQVESDVDLERRLLRKKKKNKQHIAQESSVKFYENTFSSENSTPFLLDDEVALDESFEKDVYNGKIKLTESQMRTFIKDKIGWPKFQEVFMISALKNDGVEDLRNYLLENSQSSPWLFNSSVVTDIPSQEIVYHTVRENCLEFLNHDIPYLLNYEIISWELTETDLLSIVMTIYCKDKRQYFAGFKNYKRIATESENTLRSIFRNEVRLIIRFAMRS